MKLRTHLLVVAAVAIACGGSVPTSEAAVPANGRAWELLTPTKPNSAWVLSAMPLGNNDGRVLYASVGPMPGAPSGATVASNLALRGESGWSSTPLGFPYIFKSPEVFAQLFPMLMGGLSDDDSTAIWLSATPLIPGAPPEGYVGLYRQGPDGTLSVIANLGEHLLLLLENYVDLSGDGAHTVFTDEEHVLPSDAGRVEGASIYDSTQAGLQQVDVTTASSLLSPCGSALSSANGMSENGQRIFFSNPDPSTSCAEPSRVYLRTGGETIEVSASHCNRLDCNAPADTEFAGATPSGSSVFMTTTQQLTNEDTDVTRDLYRYRSGSGTLSLVSDSPPEADGEVKGGVVHPSDDGSRVYFCATGRLVPGKGAEAGENLYWADEVGLHFVASIPCPEEIQLARDGRSALLGTSVALVAGDTDESKDVYLYDADGNTMTRLSAGPGGGNGSFDASIASGLGETFSFGREPLFRSITEDAGEAFFTTAEKLAPGDVNPVADVYEWSNGQVDLVSSGTGETEARFGSVSPDGRTVLFETTATLLPADVDGGDGDLYVARKGGGFPEPEPEPSPECAEATCEAASRPRVARPSPASSAPKGREGRIRLLEVSGGGDPTLKVSVPWPGLLSAKGRARLDGSTRVVARGSTGAVHAGRVRMPLRLSAAAQRALARGDSLKVHLVVREAELRLARTIDLGPGGSR
jgi:hypothetical protein